MISHRKLATAVTAATLLATGAAQASDQLTFPSASGALIAASTTTFVQQAPEASAEANGISTTLAVTGTGSSAGTLPPPRLPLGRVTHLDGYSARSQGNDAYTYALLSRALASASFANYAADYYRLFSPSYAVTSWTERMAGIVDVGYGGAVDGWTAGTYYLGRVRGPSRRRETAPDLSVMPTFRPHPELDESPTFVHPGH